MAAYLVINACAARLLHDDFGYFVVCVTASTVLGQLGLLGVHRGGLREAARMQSDDLDGRRALRGDVRVASWVLLPTFSVLTTVVSFAVSPGLSLADRAVLAVSMGLLVWLGGHQKLWASYLRGFGHVRLASLMEGMLGGALVGSCQAVLLAALLVSSPDAGLSAALAALAAGFVIPVALARGWVTGVWRGVAAPPVTPTAVRAVVTRHWRFASNLLSGYLNGVAEVWIAALVLSRADASMFGAAQRLASLLIVPLGAITLVLSPVISRLAEQDDVVLERLLRTAATLGFVFTAIGWIPMLVVPAPLLDQIYGPGFADGWPVLMLLTLGSLGAVVAGLSGVALTMSRHEGVVATVTWSALVLRVTAGLVLAATVGAVGLGASAAVVTVATYVVLWQVTRQRMGLRTEPTLHPAWRLLQRTAG
jgi:O-antigen/teichoic acid export membrane protein